MCVCVCVCVCVIKRSYQLNTISISLFSLYVIASNSLYSY